MEREGSRNGGEAATLHSIEIENVLWNRNGKQRWSIRQRKESAHIENLRHHLQRTFQRGVLDGRLGLVIEGFRPSKVLHGEESGVEGYSDLVENVVGELSGGKKVSTSTTLFSSSR